MSYQEARRGKRKKNLASRWIHQVQARQPVWCWWNVDDFILDRLGTKKGKQILHDLSYRMYMHGTNTRGDMRLSFCFPKFVWAQMEIPGFLVLAWGGCSCIRMAMLNTRATPLSLLHAAYTRPRFLSTGFFFLSRKKQPWVRPSRGLHRRRRHR